MAACPSCHKEITKRKDGACPLCGQEVQLFKGRYYRTEDGSPTMAIVGAFEKLVGQQLSRAQGTTIPFRINRKGSMFRVELVTAESLLDACDGDLELVRRALTEMFTNRMWAWKSRTTMRNILTDFTGALAIAQVAHEKERKNAEREQDLATILSNKEDVFA